MASERIAMVSNLDSRPSAVCRKSMEGYPVHQISRAKRLPIVMALLALSVVPARISSADSGALDLTGGAIPGVTLVATTVVDIAPVTDATTLAFDRVWFPRCAVAVGSAAAGDVLIVAEGGDVTVVVMGVETILAQGAAAHVPAGGAYEILGTGDFGALVDVVSVGGPSSDFVPAEPSVAWPEGSPCVGVEAAASPLGAIDSRQNSDGYSGENFDQLYIGYGIIEPGATTEGFIMAGDASSLNFHHLNGAMQGAGATTGASWMQFATSTNNDTGAGTCPGANSAGWTAQECREASLPFTNPGTSPMFGIVFGTTTGDQPVFAPRT